MKRRLLLLGVGGGALALLLGVFAVAIHALRPTDAALSSHDKLVDLSILDPGDTLRVEWENWVVIVLHRDEEQVHWLRNYVPPSLESGREDDLPPRISYRGLRSDTPDYLVVAVWRINKLMMLNEGRLTASGCDDFRYTREQIRTGSGVTFPGGFYCASMYGHAITDLSKSPYVYDPAGRSAFGYYQPLSVPPHRIVGKSLLLSRSG